MKKVLLTIIAMFCIIQPFNGGIFQADAAGLLDERDGCTDCNPPDTCSFDVCTCDSAACSNACGECNGLCEVTCHSPDSCNSGICACDPVKCEALDCMECKNGVCDTKSCPPGEYCLNNECVCDASDCEYVCGTCNSETNKCDINCGYPNVCDCGNCQCDPDECKEKCNNKFKDGCCLNGQCTCCPAAFYCPQPGAGDACLCDADKCSKICNGVCGSDKCLPQCDRGKECYTDTCRSVPGFWLSEQKD